MLSEYEEQRLANMAENQQKLVELGLVAVPKPAPPPTKPRPVEKVISKPVRSSSRQCGRPVSYAGLTHEQFLEEESEYKARRRSTGTRTSKPPYRFSPPMFHRPVSASKLMEDGAQWQQIVSLQPAQVADANSPRIPYHTLGKQGLCSRCQNWFTITKKKLLHKHICQPVMTPAVALLPSFG